MWLTAEHDGALLRQLFVHRAGHCEFTPAETVVAFEALVTRLDSGKWPALGAAGLNKAAKGLGPSFNVLSVSGKKFMWRRRISSFSRRSFCGLSIRGRISWVHEQGRSRLHRILASRFLRLRLL